MKPTERKASLPVGEQPRMQANSIGLPELLSLQDQDHLQARHEQAKRRLRKIIEQLRG